MNLWYSIFGSNETLALTNGLGIVLLVALAVLAWMLHDATPNPRYARALNCLLIILGLLSGWALAMLLVPLDQTESDFFKNIGAAISVFVSGYLVNKVDRLLEKTLFGSSQIAAFTFVRAGLFFTALLLSVVVVDTNRLDYVSKKNAAATHKAEVEAQQRALTAQPR